MSGSHPSNKTRRANRQQIRHWLPEVKVVSACFPKSHMEEPIRLRVVQNVNAPSFQAHVQWVRRDFRGEGNQGRNGGSRCSPHPGCRRLVKTMRRTATRVVCQSKTGSLPLRVLLAAKRRAGGRGSKSRACGGVTSGPERHRCLFVQVLRVVPGRPRVV